MTITEIRSLFPSETEFRLEIIDYDEWEEHGNPISFRINNLLFGTDAFAGMKVNHMRAENNRIIIESDMPMLIFNAWKKYADV